MRTLTPTERRAFRAKAHHLHPVASIGQHGLTPAVLREIDNALTAHELIKVRVFSDDRSEREALLARICDALDAAAVQHLGKILTVWRPTPQPAPPAVEPRKRPAKTSRKPARSPAPSDGRRRRTVSTAPHAKGPPGSPAPSDGRRRRTVSTAPRAKGPPGTPRRPAARRRRAP